MRRNKLEILREKLKFLKKPYILISIFLLLFIFLGLLGFFSLKHYMDERHSSSTDKIEVVVTSGEHVRDIASDLASKKLINHDLIFVLYLKYKGFAGDIKAGEYEIAKNCTPLEVIDILTNGKVASRQITIPEGWTNNQISDYLQKNSIVSKEQFIAATNKKYNYSFLNNLPEGASLEGFLFPDTYQLSKNVTADEIVVKMLDNFDKKMTAERKAEIAGTKYSIYETITLASIVEREVSKPQDRKLVAGIFLARLDEGMALESCATIQYILDSNKRIFSFDETRTPSAYNTYLNPGLPAGPIGNPGLEAIDAVIHPEMTDFRYFLSDDKGNTYYSKTLSEHEDAKAKYLSQ